MMRPVALAGLALLLTSASHAFLSSSAPTRPITTTTTSALLTAPNDAEYDSHHQNQDRRRFLTWAATTALVTAAGATPGAYGDPAALTTQGVTRSRQVEAVNQPESDAVDQLWEEELPGGVSYREYRRGKGDAGTSRVQYSCLVEQSYPRCCVLLCILSYFGVSIDDG